MPVDEPAKVAQKKPSEHKRTLEGLVQYWPVFAVVIAGIIAFGNLKSDVSALRGTTSERFDALQQDLRNHREWHRTKVGSNDEPRVAEDPRDLLDAGIASSMVAFRRATRVGLCSSRRGVDAHFCIVDVLGEGSDTPAESQAEYEDLINSLVILDRMDDARRAARRYREAHPNEPLSSFVRQSLNYPYVRLTDDDSGNDVEHTPGRLDASRARADAGASGP